MSANAASRSVLSPRTGEQGTLALLRISQLHLEAKLYDEARRELDEALRVDPELALAYVMRARVHVEQGKLDKALDDCDRALRVNSRQAEAHALRGHVLHRLGAERPAVEAYLAALRVRPDLVLARLSLGYLYKNLGENREAVRTLRKVLRENPDVLAAHLLLSEIRMGEGRLREALAHAQHAVRLNPYLPRAHYAMGKCLLGLDRLDEAHEAFSAAAEVNPIRLIVPLARAQRHLKEGNHDAALAWCRRALKIQPQFFWARALEGMTLVALDRPREAIDALRQALVKCPGAAQVHYHLGRAYHLLGQPLEATLCYQEAIRINPLLTEAHAQLGHLSADGGLPERALEVYALGTTMGVEMAEK